jgi:hypothetical protein
MTRLCNTSKKSSKVLSRHRSTLVDVVVLKKIDPRLVGPRLVDPDAAQQHRTLWYYWFEGL